MMKILVLLLLLVPGPLHAQLEWPEVTREAKPWTRWWWLGSAVDSANLHSELQELAEAGFGGVEVTSIYGIKGQEPRHIPYLSDRWIGMLGYAAAEANRLGMGLDMPPGSGWKMGGPDVPLAESSRSLRLVADTAASGAVTWRAEIRNNNEQVKRPGPGGEGNVVDVLDEESVEDYLDYFGDRLDRLPEGIVRSFFHDSYEYSGDASAGLFEAFQARRGYDLRDYAAALAGEGDPETAARVRSDYRQTVAEMLLDNLIEPFTAWAHDQGSLSRNQAHGSPGNILDLYAASDIPETEIFGPLDGSDADPLISKFASSAAHVAGKPRASAESMTWLGEHWTVSLDDVKQAVDGLFVSGINHVFFHGTAYSPEDAAWPGWLFYASTQFNDRNAFWHDIPALNDYIARVQSVMQSGVPDNDVLLYWPVWDSWHSAEGRRPRMDFRVHDPEWFYGQAIGDVATDLWESGVGFDYVSDRLLEEAVEVEDGALVAEGGARYDVLLVPYAEHMPLETLERLLDLAEAGATVLFAGGLPEDVPGLQELEERRRELAEERGRVRIPANAGAVAVVSLGAGRVLLAEDEAAGMVEIPAPAARLLIAAGGVHPSRVVTDHEGVQAIRRRWEGGYLYFVTNARGEETVDKYVPFPVASAAVAILDPMTGRTGLARTQPIGDRGTDIYLRLEPGQSLLLRTFDSPVQGEPWRYLEPTDEAVALEGPWRVDFVEGGPTLPESFTTPSLGSWTARGPAAEAFAGTARYTLRFDLPDAIAGDRLLDLGRVAESARVRLNGQDLGTLFARPFTLPVPAGALRPRGNVLEVEVTNLSANRIRDLDRRGVEWRIFHDINFVNIDYQPFDASGWEVRESGLVGPVRLVRVE